MGFLILVRRHLYVESGPCTLRRSGSTSKSANKFAQSSWKLALIIQVTIASEWHCEFRPNAHTACLVQIWWFQLKSVMSYRADKLKFADAGQMDRQTDTGYDNTRTAWKARGKNYDLYLPVQSLIVIKQFKYSASLNTNYRITCQSHQKVQCNYSN